MSHTVMLLVQITLEPSGTTHRPSLRAALDRLAAATPVFEVTADGGAGPIVIGGPEEAGLAEAVRCLRDAGLDLHAGRPEVVCRETIARMAVATHTHREQTGGGAFARVGLRLAPDPALTGCHFEVEAEAAGLPALLALSVETAARASLVQGWTAGLAMTGVRVTLAEAAWHERDSTVGAFAAAATAATRTALRQAEPRIVWPVMRAEIAAPAAFVFRIREDLLRRKADLADMTGQSGEEQVLRALVPMAALLGYAETLRDLSEGRGRFALHFSHYAPVALPIDHPPFRPAAGMRG